ncbi:pantetheine-phosphate adenylyltransferase [Abyssibacter profundi]|uniref:Phosphopantetheine adenylyltransferase n=1 Tax=Abyssibacter profundi TaxID=2182787 RepID=A0A363UNI8_9GAMM|nr:pantetheine-phosphate adenylyltransferase [Abyssibacter profundi]MBV60830.1 pantetheine-phosphate adenylyltransferase [Nevskiales bacterium]PWN56993.1 pantetheine-phosphate adenylyltransferase [Abyssibacter profundi]
MTGDGVIAAYSGTFDPMTYGHTDIIHRAAAMFPKLIVAVGENLPKGPVFSLDERVALARQALQDLPNVDVVPFTGLVVDFASEHGVTVLVRGVRSVSDFDYEKQMAVMNRYLSASVDTVMLAPSKEYAHLSSSLVRELARLGGNVEGVVPEPIAQALHDHYGTS